VGHLAQRLEHHQAGVGVLPVGAPAQHVARELQVVGGRVEAAEAEPEPALARRRAVAGAGIAAAHVDRGDHVVSEADWLRPVVVLDDHRHLDRQGPRLDHQRRRAVLARRHEAAGIDGYQVPGLAAELARHGQVADTAVGVLAGDDHLLAGAGAGEGHRGGLDDQGGRRADEGGPALFIGGHGGGGGQPEQEQAQDGERGVAVGVVVHRMAPHAEPESLVGGMMPAGSRRVLGSMYPEAAPKARGFRRDFPDCACTAWGAGIAYTLAYLLSPANFPPFRPEKEATLSTFLPARLALPAILLLPLTLPAAGPPALPLYQRIDQLVASKADFARFKAPRSSDAEFLRRVYLDLTGKLPSTAEARAFLADHSPGKRRAVIDRLLASPEHALHLANVFDVMLMERRPDRFVPRAAWLEFLRSSFAANRPFDEIAREVLSGDGSDPKKRYRVKFFLERKGEPNVITRDIGRLFLGTNLQCAQCHDHPRVEDYRQEHYYGLFAFISRSSPLNDRRRRTMLLSEKADGETTYQSVFDPKKVTKTALPRVPGGPALVDPPLDKKNAYQVAPAPGVAGVPRYSRRAQLAKALARADYVPFRRNIANRLWALLMGRGLVEPLDMDHGGNPPSHPELLDLLAEDVAARKFDVRGFLRELALSETYQRSSEPPAGLDPKDAPLYATAILKPLTPEQLAWSLMEATGLVETTRQALGKKPNPAVLQARLAPNVAVFVRTFASPAGKAQSFDARLDQALFLANGLTVRSWLVNRPGSLVGRLAKLSGAAMADELYLSVFTRLPDDEERREAADFLARRPGAYADLAWALLASTEFRFNH
jgi:hypothetical protein